LRSFAVGHYLNRFECSSLHLLVNVGQQPYV
jgi:hypothetical protein